MKETEKPKMVKHRIEIVETLTRIVEVELPADQEREARERVIDMYRSEEVVLTSDDYFETEFIYLDQKDV